MALILFFSGTLFGERRPLSIVVEPKGADEMPFLLLKSFGFEGALGGWMVVQDGAPTNVSLENQEDAAFEGSGFLRLRTSLPGTEQESSIPFSRTVTLRYWDPQLMWFVDGVVAYIKVNPSDQTIENRFYAEIQVHATWENQHIWSKTRYPLTPGVWTPVVWTKPTWLTSGDERLYFPNNVDAVYIMIWSEKPYTGRIGIDSVNLYIIKRP